MQDVRTADAQAAKRNRASLGQTLLKGEVDVAILSLASLLTWYRDGKLKILAVGSPERSTK